MILFIKIKINKMRKMINNKENKIIRIRLKYQTHKYKKDKI